MIELLLKYQNVIREIVLSALNEYVSGDDRISLNRASTIMRIKGYRNPRKILRQWEREGRIKICGSRGNRLLVSKAELHQCIAADIAAGIIA